MTREHANDAARAQVLAKAVANAAAQLGISNAELAGVLDSDGVPESIELGSIVAKRAANLIECYKLLNTITTGDVRSMRAWLRAYNEDIKNAPLNIIQSDEGVQCLLEYLSSRLNRG